MTASSFNYTPGLPILVSKDLVNWELACYALENIGEERYRIPRHSEGVWAPSIRCHEGMFYIYYGMPDEGYYVVRTKDPLGKWEEPVCALKGKGLIDPCPFWDEDGRAYIVHGYAKSRIGFKSFLGMFEISADGLEAISEDHFIFDGNDPEHPALTIEGPKVYKRNGWYYIWAPAGGVRQGYQVVLRSRDINGPYEIKTVMHQGNTVINGPHQGGLVDTLSGQEWFIHFQDRGLYGRICHLQPVTWQDDWPVVGINPDENGCGEPAYELDKPDTGHDSGSIMSLSSSDDFRNGKIGLQWQWLGDHDDSFYGDIPDTDSEKEIKNGLRLFCLNPSGDEEPTIWRSANVLTQKLIYPAFEAKVLLDATGLKHGERAGVVMTGAQYLTAYIEREGDQYFVCTAESEGNDQDKTEVVKSRIPLEEFWSTLSDHKRAFPVEELLFRMTFYNEEEFSCRCEDNSNYEHSGKLTDMEDLYFRNVADKNITHAPVLHIELGTAGSDSTTDNDETDHVVYKDLGVSFTPSDHTWVGAKLGIYALGKGSVQSFFGYADFHSVTIMEKTN